MSGLNRTHTVLNHSQNLGGGLGLALNLNRVSDDAYFRDLSSSVAVTSQTNLLRDGVLSYGAGWWSASARVQRYQTLQDPLAPVAVPYRLQPQISLNAQQNLTDANIQVASQYTDFRHDTDVNGQRMVIYPSVSYPLLNDLGYYVTPKLGLHYTKYLMGLNNTQGLPDATRTLPIFSMDSGMVLRARNDASREGFMCRHWSRAFYVYMPYQDQSHAAEFRLGTGTFQFWPDIHRKPFLRQRSHR